jgi:hypothetical protein
MAISTQKIAQLYIGTFGSNPSADDVNKYTAISPVESVVASAMASDAGLSSDDNSALVTSVFQNLFGRDPLTDGLDFYTTHLENGTMNTSNIVYWVLANAADADAAASADAGAAAVAAIEDTEPATPVETTGETYTLTANQDDLTGTDNADTFNAYIFDNQNTLQSGDMVDGGASTDRLFADIGDSQSFAITPHTTSVEQLAIRAQDADNLDASDNNMTDNEVQIDAERMNGTDWYESNNSRADVVIEDVRIEDSQITGDITIAMVETDPGDVDFGVYFDQHSLRAAPESTSGAVLNLELMDTRSADNGLDPLLEQPYNGFAFSIDGTTYEVQSTEIDQATTYAELLTAVQNAVADTDGLDDITVSLSGTFTAIDTLSGNVLTGQTLTLTNNGEGTMAEGSWLTADGTTPASGGLHTEQNTDAPSTSGNLIVSTIILDDVGRGSQGGDLVVGGLSTGLSSNSQGVEEFQIKVDRDSMLESVASTNNTLEEVYIKNVDHFADSDSEATGGLTIGVTAKAAADDQGDLNGDAGEDDVGLTDVRIVDASEMVGSVNITAELTDGVAAKYFERTDDSDNASYTTDNDYENDGHTAGMNGFVYTLGTNNDTLTLAISESNLEAAGTTSREDFSLAINGGDGNDTITTTISTAATNDLTNWYTNSKDNANLSIDSGAGDDTVATVGAGDFTISTGSGKDTVYTDNSGTVDATWILNADNADLTDLDGNALASQFLYKSSVKVTVSGPQTAGESGVVDPDANSEVVGFESDSVTITTDYTANQADFNQAIKKAINDDAILSKLLLASDGPGNTLVISSLVDGAFDADDLQIEFAAYDVDALNGTGTEYTTALSAWRDYNTDSTLADLDTADLAAQVAAFTAANTSYGTTMVMGSNGTASVTASDNTVNLGTGNDDIVVLSTDDASNETIVLSGTNFGHDTIVNFTQGNATTTDSVDALDFSSYLTSVESVSGSTESQATIATTINTDTSVEANSVTIINDFVETTTETWESLTGAELLAAINNDNTDTEDAYASIGEADLDAVNVANLVGTTYKAIIMIENDDNAGEYKVFDVTATDNGDFTAASLVGTVDFGAELTNFTAFNLNGNGSNHLTGTVTSGGSTPTTGGGTTTVSATGVNTYTVDMSGDDTTDGTDTVIDFPSANVSISNTDISDGEVTLTWNDGTPDNEATVTLTGLTTAQDADAYSVAQIDTLFGAGTIA